MCALKTYFNGAATGIGVIQEVPTKALVARIARRAVVNCSMKNTSLLSPGDNVWSICEDELRDDDGNRLCFAEESPKMFL